MKNSRSRLTRSSKASERRSKSSHRSPNPVHRTLSFAVVIPAYNEEKRIGEVLHGIKKFAKTAIVVDDASIDKTGQIAKSLGAVVLRHKINLGVGAAKKTGVEAAWRLGMEAVVTLDADGQHDPKHIPEFIEELRNGSEIVFGSRNLGFNIPLVRYLGNKAGAVLINLLFGIYRGDLLCGYLAFTKNAYKKIKWESSTYGIETEIVARTGKNRLKFSEVPIEAIYIDKYKGMTILEGLSLLPSVLRWRFLD